MAIVNGVVSANVTNKYGHGINVNNNWYNSKYPIKCEKGDHVEFDDGGKNYCRQLKVLQGGAIPPASYSGPQDAAIQQASKVSFSKDRSIIRQNSLSHATQISIANQSTKGKISAEDVIALARQFEAYSTGDLDIEAAEEIANVGSSTAEKLASIA